MDKVYLETTGEDIRSMAASILDVRERIVGHDIDYDKLEKKVSALGYAIVGMCEQEADDALEQIALLYLLSQNCAITAMAAVDSFALKAAIEFNDL